MTHREGFGKIIWVFVKASWFRTLHFYRSLLYHPCMNYVSYIKWYVLHRYFDCKQEISTKHLKINVCEDVTTANIMISYLFWIFDYNLRCDSLKKEYPANFLPFRRHFWRDSNGGLPLSFYWNVGKKKRQDKCSQNRSHRQDIHTHED